RFAASRTTSIPSFMTPSEPATGAKRFQMAIKRSVQFKHYPMLASYIRTLVLLALATGCSGRPGRVATPGVDADDAAHAALELYDKNGNAELDGSELAASPSLMNALPGYDSNKDGSLSQAELVAGMQRWSQR